MGKRRIITAKPQCALVVFASTRANARECTHTHAPVHDSVCWCVFHDVPADMQNQYTVRLGLLRSLNVTQLLYFPSDRARPE